VQATITSIDPEARRVGTDAGEFSGDVMVVALGADLDPAATPGLPDGGHVYAVGDVTSAGTPKAGVFSEGQARVVASAIIDRVSGRRPSAGYDGRGQCYLEFGRDQVAVVDVTFTQGTAPSGWFDGPSGDLAGQKAEFGSSRARRWFGRDWQAT
jgi:NADH dehydrogenase FAD-containing subunit